MTKNATDPRWLDANGDPLDEKTEAWHPDRHPGVVPAPRTPPSPPRERRV